MCHFIDNLIKIFPVIIIVNIEKSLFNKKKKAFVLI